ncbi:MAG: lipopolysaccharide biosynthesis protein [Bacteroidota bacterium]
MQYNTDRIKKDLIWYIAGAFLPMAVLLVRSPVFTRVFSPEEYGQYTLINLIFLYLSTLKLEWIRTSIWRYYIKYKKRGLQQRFHHAVSAFYILSATSILLVTAIWFFFTPNPDIKKLIAFGAANLLTQELITIIMITQRIEGRSKYYNIINSTRTAGGFLLLLILAFRFDFTISAFFLAPALVNTIYLVFLLPKSNFIFPPHFAIITGNDLKRFVHYGFTGTLTMLATFLLISSDRWVINYFHGLDKTGIYNQTYMLGQMSIMALITVLNASFNPYLINNIEQNKQATNTYVSNVFRWFFYLIFPMAVYISLYAREISTLLLGPEFREAWHIIPLITFGFMFEGLCHFSSIKLKFFNRLRFLFLGVFIATLINLSLNFYLIPRMNYTIAAYTTLFSYLVLFLFYYVSASSTYLHAPQNRKFIVAIMGVMGLQVGIHFIINPYLPDYHPLVLAGIEFTVFAMSYLGITLPLSPLKGDLTANKQN